MVSGNIQNHNKGGVEMLVGLPKKTSGKKLLSAIKEAAEEIKADGYGIERLGLIYRYEPGSPKRVIAGSCVMISKEIIKKKRFLIRSKDKKEFHYPALGFPELSSDKNYGEINIEIYGCGWDEHYKKDIRGEDLETIRPVFEKLLFAIYQRLDSSRKVAQK